MIFAAGVNYPDWNETIIHFYSKELIEKSTEISSYAYYLFVQLLKLKFDELEKFPHFIEIFVKGLYFGTVPRKDQRYVCVS